MLREYQIKSINLIREKFSKGVRKVLLKSATGSGKTVMFCEILKSASSKGTKCLLVTRGRKIVDQASKRLFKEQVRHGVRMAGHWNKDYGAKVQVASIDTLIARNDYPEAELIVIDEADQATSDGYKKFIEQYPNAYVLGVTATPYGDKSLRHIADEIVSAISIKELVVQGHLVPFRYFAPSAPDMRGVRSQNGDFVSEQSEEKMSGLTGDIVQHYKELGNNRPTILFAVNVHHSKIICDTLNSNGIPASHVDALNDDEEREEEFKKLEDGRIKILCTVGIATRGVDLPFVSCLIMARPTKSYSLYIQMLGRGSRINKGKSDCIILDHAGNVLRHGFFDDEPEANLDGREFNKLGPSITICQKCYVAFTGESCHACGYCRPVTTDKNDKKELKVDEGVLEELKELPIGMEVSIYIRRLKRNNKGCNKLFLHAKVQEKYGKQVADQAFGERGRPLWKWKLNYGKTW